VSQAAVKLLSGPAGYAVPLLIGLAVVYVIYRQLKAPAAAAYAGAQNFDQNIGLGGFDTWVSGLFSPPTAPVSPNLGANSDMGGPNFGTTGLGW